MSYLERLPRDLLRYKFSDLDLVTLININKAYPRLISEELLTLKLTELKNLPHKSENYSQIIDKLYDQSLIDKRYTIYELGSDFTDYINLSEPIYIRSGSIAEAILKIEQYLYVKYNYNFIDKSLIIYDENWEYIDEDEIEFMGEYLTENSPIIL